MECCPIAGAVAGHGMTGAAELQHEHIGEPVMVIEKKRAIERRRHQRHTTIRACKVRDRRTLLFAPGKTTDLSVSGALIRVDRVRPFAQGDELDLVVAWDNDAIVPGDSMIRATVRRVMPIDYHHQAVAIQFEAPAEQHGEVTHSPRVAA